MSYKVSMKNGINCTEAQWIKSNNLVDTSVKLAGEEAKDRLYEPKHKKKLVRVLTVIAYVFFVSLAAIMLSLYYVFLWNGGQRNLPKIPIQHEPTNNLPKCENVVAEIMEPQIEVSDKEIFSTSSSTADENTTFPDYSPDIELGKTRSLLKKLIYKNYLYPKND